jgi:ribonuclease BN (tRNA processing enzyme)
MPTSLVTIGTGTVVPSGERGSPSHWVECGEVRLLMDCGAGTIHRLARFGLPWPEITHVGITHYHHDHIGELGALLYAFMWGQVPPRTAPLVLLGPAGFRTKLQTIAAAYGDWVTAPGFPLEVIELAPGPELTLVRGVTLDVCRVPHTDESLAFAVATPDGRLVYTGDTGPSEVLGDWARGCDLLLAECSLPDAMALDLHLTPRQAGELAARAGAKRLVLTHLYPPVETVDLTGEIARVYRGPVTVARDGERFAIGA